MLQISHLLVRDSFTRFVWSANDFSQRLRGGTVISKFSHCVFQSIFRLVLIYFFRVRLVNDYADMRTSRTSKSSKVVWTNLNIFRGTVSFEAFASFISAFYSVPQNVCMNQVTRPEICLYELQHFVFDVSTTTVDKN